MLAKGSSASSLGVHAGGNAYKNTAVRLHTAELRDACAEQSR
jgi:hypothetical protein